MKRKSILSLAAIIVVSISLVGCGDGSKTGNNATGNPNTANNATGNMNGTNDGTTGNPNTANNATNDADTTRNATGNTDNDVNNSVNNSINSVTDAMKYTGKNFRDDVTNAGYKIKESTDTNKNYFSGNETDYLMGTDLVRVYEYNSANDLQNDVSRISQNGLTINGTDANYTTKPNYYRKGNSLIVYEGNEPAYIDHFETTYGNTLIP